MFEAITWTNDREFCLNGHAFSFVQYDAEERVAESADNRFDVYKNREILDDYELALGNFGSCDSIVEVGMFHGGSAVLLAEALRPRKLVGFDIESKSTSPVFDRYVAENEPIEVHWGADQGDRSTVLGALDDAGLATVDLVIDDASHLYEKTVETFNMLFPRVRPGGLYLIEDWSWPFSEQWAESAWLRCHRSLSDILLDVAGLKAARPDAVGRITVYRAFIAVERGPAQLDHLDLVHEPYRRSSYRRNARMQQARQRVASKLRNFRR